jgi:hypothetical protein
MKKSLLLCLLISTGLVAQPTFTSSDMYGVNYSFLTRPVTNPASIEVSNTGANSIWSFPDLTLGEESNNSFMSPAGKPGASNFPTANLCQAVTSLGGNPGYSYLKSTSSAFSIDGVFSSQVGYETVSQFNPDMDLFRFPFTFNSTFTQPIGGTTTTNISGVDYVYFREGSQTTICDGYGTLTTPLGTFQNVLRLKTTQIYTDSIDFQGISQVYHYVSTIYNWVSAQSKGASLLSQTTFSVDGTETVSGSVSSVPTVGIAEISNQLQFNIFPNPVKEQLTLQLPALAKEKMSVEVLSITGQILIKAEILNQQTMQFHIPVDGIAPGTYFLRVSDSKTSGLKRFIVM